MSKIISTSELQKKVSQVVHDVANNPYIVVNRGEAKTVLLPYFENCDNAMREYLKVFEEFQIEAGIKRISKKFDLDLLIVFGSCAEGVTTSMSDLDLAFYRQKPMKAEEENRLHADLMYLYKREDIDLINIRDTYNALLRYQIFMQGKPLFEKRSGLFAKMRWQAYIDFEDFKCFYADKSELLDKTLETLIQ